MLELFLFVVEFSKVAVVFHRSRLYEALSFAIVEVAATFACYAVDCAACTAEGAVHAFAVHTVGAWAVAFFVGLFDNISL